MEIHYSLAAKETRGLWFGIMVIGIDHPYTHREKYAPHVKIDGPRGICLNIKGLLFLSNQSSRKSLFCYDDKYWLFKHPQW